MFASYLRNSGSFLSTTLRCVM